MTWFELKNRRQSTAGFDRCDGEVEASVSIVNTGCCCHSGEELEVKYRCQKCGNTFYPELPDAEWKISRFVTRLIADMSGAAHLRLKKEQWALTLELRKPASVRMAAAQKRTK